MNGKNASPENPLHYTKYLSEDIEMLADDEKDYITPVKSARIFYLFESLNQDTMAGFEPQERLFLDVLSRSHGEEPFSKDKEVEERKQAKRLEKEKEKEKKSKEEKIRIKGREERRLELEEKKKKELEKEKKRKRFTPDGGEEWHSLVLRQVMMRMVSGLKNTFTEMFHAHWQKSSSLSPSHLLASPEEAMFWCVFVCWYGDLQYLERRSLIPYQSMISFFFFFLF